MQIIGVKELQANLKKVKEETLKGEEFVVTSNGKAVFKIVPFMLTKSKKKMKLQESIEFFNKIKFKGGDPDLSKKIDEIAWD